MYIQSVFYEPNIYSSASADGYSFVTGTGTHQTVDGYKLIAFTCINATGSTIYAQIYDGYSASAIVGHTPIQILQVSANSQGSLDLGSVNCIPVKKGILIAASSTPLTFTPVASAMYNSVYFI